MKRPADDELDQRPPIRVKWSRELELSLPRSRDYDLALTDIRDLLEIAEGDGAKRLCLFEGAKTLLSKAAYERLRHSDASDICLILGDYSKKSPAPIDDALINWAMSIVSPRAPAPAADLPPPKDIKPLNPNNVTFKIVDARGKTSEFILGRDQKLGRALDRFKKEHCTDMPEVAFRFEAEEVEGDQTPNDIGLVNGDLIECHLVVIGGKPVILLYSPDEREVATSLTLAPSWDFSALYPVKPIAKGKDGSSTTTWRVRTDKDGLLTDLDTNVRVSYLFWEAEALLEVDEGDSQLLFDPRRPVLTPANGVAVCKEEVVAYLERVLDSFGLTVSARTDFISFWIPQINAIRQSHIALRFLSPDEIEGAASLRIEPQPDFLMRVFMLFKGVDATVDERWRGGDKVDWREMVGVDEQRSDLFRVVEWGGMALH